MCACFMCQCTPCSLRFHTRAPSHHSCLRILSPIVAPIATHSEIVADLVGFLVGLICSGLHMRCIFTALHYHHAERPFRIDFLAGRCRWPHLLCRTHFGWRHSPRRLATAPSGSEPVVGGGHALSAAPTRWSSFLGVASPCPLLLRTCWRRRSSGRPFGSTGERTEESFIVEGSLTRRVVTLFINICVSGLERHPINILECRIRDQIESRKLVTDVETARAAVDYLSEFLQPPQFAPLRRNIDLMFTRALRALTRLPTRFLRIRHAFPSAHSSPAASIGLSTHDVCNMCSISAQFLGRPVAQLKPVVEYVSGVVEGSKGLLCKALSEVSGRSEPRADGARSR